ncbi:hypothetical protein ACU4GD_29895 [Cupriavidus basilensis]
MARFGEMMRLGGRFNGQQIVPKSGGLPMSETAATRPSSQKPAM